MPSRPSLLAVGALLLALLAAAPLAPAVEVRGGFDTLAQLIQQIDGNIQATHRVTVAHFKKQSKRCNDTLDDLSLQLQAKRGILRVANDTIAKASANIDQLEGQIAPLRETITVDRLDFSRVESKLNQGQKERDEENQLNVQKLQDTNTIISVVNRVLTALLPPAESSESSSSAASQFQFTELMQGAAATVKDATVARLLSSAIATIQATAKTPDNLDRLRKLLQLLIVELQTYKAEIDNQEKVALAQWSPIRDDLGKKKFDAQKKLDDHLAALADLQKQVDSNNQTIAEAQAVLNGPVRHQFHHLKEQYETKAAICKTLSDNFQAEQKQREEQSSTIEALTQIVSNQKDNRQSIDGIDDIILPPPMGCCKICQGDFAACGDNCVGRETLASSQCTRGCACDMDDPRMAASGIEESSSLTGTQ